MPYLLFTIYLLFFTYIVTRISFIRNTGLGSKTIISLFSIKVFAGLFLGWLSKKYAPGNDYWGLNQDGLFEYHLLMTDPREFFTNIFRSPYDNGYSGLFNSIGSYWNDLRYNIILKMLAFTDIFSRGNYYINSLFFNFFGFFGPVALYRVFKHVFPEKKWAVLIGCFLLPSTVYFSAGVHKDLIVFTLLGLYCYAFYFAVMQRAILKRIVFIFFSLIGLMLIRNFVVIALLPVSVAFFISVKRKISPVLTALAVYSVGMIIILALQVFTPSFQPLKVITQKQADFSNLQVAASQLPMKPLQPDLKSFLMNSGQAFNHGFLRPYMWETSGTFLLPLAVELLLYEFILLFLLFSRSSFKKLKHPFVIFSMCFGIFMILITGYIVPNTGSIVRYRSIYLPFIITPILALIAKNDKHYKL